MEKSSKLTKLKHSVVLGASAILIALGISSTLHHLITITSVLFLISVGIYLLWSKS